MNKLKIPDIITDDSLRELITTIYDKTKIKFNAITHDGFCLDDYNTDYNSCKKYMTKNFIKQAKEDKKLANKFMESYNNIILNINTFFSNMDATITPAKLTEFEQNIDEIYKIIILLYEEFNREYFKMLALRSINSLSKRPNISMFEYLSNFNKN